MKYDNLKVDTFYTADFAYWIGVVQTDGYFKIQKRKNCEGNSYRVVLNVAKKSLPMMNKFVSISKKLFRSDGSFYLSKNSTGNKMFIFSINCKEFVNVFAYLDIDFKKVDPPNWILSKANLFGPYLAGVIDGDGNTRITISRYPQCYIRIISGEKLKKLTTNIKKILNCGVHISKRSTINTIAGYSFASNSYVTEFKVSSKNIDFFKEHIIENIQIPYKREAIMNYIKLKEGGRRDLNAPKENRAVSSSTVSYAAELHHGRHAP